MKVLGFIIGILILVSFVSAPEFGYNNLDGPIMVPPINYTEIVINETANDSILWNGNPYNASRYGLWKREGTTVSPFTSEDDIATTGDVDIGSTGNGKLYVSDGTKSTQFSDGSYAVYSTDGTYTAYTIAGLAGYFSDSSRSAQFADGSYAGYLSGNNRNTYIGGSSWGLEVDASGAGSGAGRFYDSSRAAEFATGTYGGHIWDSSLVAQFAFSGQAAHFEDGTRQVDIADGTYGVEAVTSSITTGRLSGSSYGLYGYKDSGGSAGGYVEDSSYNFVQMADDSNALYSYHGSTGNYMYGGASSYGGQFYLSSGTAAVQGYDNSGNYGELASGGYPGYFHDTNSNYVYAGGGSANYVLEVYHSYGKSGTAYFYDSSSGNYMYGPDSTYGMYVYNSGGSYAGYFTDTSSNYVYMLDSSYGLYSYRSGGTAGYFSDGSSYVSLATGSYAVEAGSGGIKGDHYSSDGTQGTTTSCGSSTTLTVKDGLITGCA